MPINKIVCQGMDSREKEKFDRMSELLGTVFDGAGFHDVSCCQAATNGTLRQLLFYRKTESLPLMVLTSEEFISCTGDELRNLMLARIANSRNGKPTAD